MTRRERIDTAIQTAARRVFLNDPAASMNAVAAAAGVGMSAVYLRYESKVALLQSLCLEGQRHYLAATHRALERDRDTWETFVRRLEELIHAETHVLFSRLAGTFPPSEESYALARQMEDANDALFARLHAAGVLREGLTPQDVALLLAGIGNVQFEEVDVALAARRRLLSVIIPSLGSTCTHPVAGEPVSWASLSARWDPPTRG